MKARDIMTSEFPVVAIKTPIGDAIRMLKKNFGDESFLNAAPALVVVNEKGELAGILSPLSIIEALLQTVGKSGYATAEGRPSLEDLCFGIKDKLVEDIMDWHPISVTEDADILDVAALFTKNRFQRIPVVKNKGVTGIIYRSRLLFAMTSCLLK